MLTFQPSSSSPFRTRQSPTQLLKRLLRTGTRVEDQEDTDHDSGLGYQLSSMLPVQESPLQAMADYDYDYDPPFPSPSHYTLMDSAHHENANSHSYV